MIYGAPEQGPDAAFQEHVADGHLWIQRCAACGAAVFHPRCLCPECGSGNLDWQRASGRGTVYSCTVLLKRPREGESTPQQHCLVLVTLEEGPRLMSRLPDTPVDQIHIGMAVQARITGEEGSRAVVFDPVEAGA